tara:strand:- start:775 stop:1218 length:444 start_codon:yes stop_codon:yes gene_type:complete
MVKLRHVGITVTDMKKSLQLYKDCFDFEIVWDEIEKGEFIDNLSNLKDVEVHTVKLKDSNGGMIELLQYLSHPKLSDVNKINKINEIGCSHIAITVDDISNLYEKLIGMGLEFNYKPTRHPDIDVKAKVAFCRDFDGTLIEIVEEVE